MTRDDICQLIERRHEGNSPQQGKIVGERGTGRVFGALPHGARFASQRGAVTR